MKLLRDRLFYYTSIIRLCNSEPKLEEYILVNNLLNTVLSQKITVGELRSRFQMSQLETMTLRQLRKFAVGLKIKNYNNLTKERLMGEIHAKQSSKDALSSDIYDTNSGRI